MTQNEIVQIIAGFIGSVGFGVLFNIKGKRLLMAGLGGLLSWLLFCIFNDYIKNDAVNYFAVSCLISIYAEIMARILKTPATAFTITSLIPLIPGGSLYYTMAYAFESTSGNFLEKGIYTLQLAAALALGIIVAAAVTKIVVPPAKQKISK